MLSDFFWVNEKWPIFWLLEFFRSFAIHYDSSAGSSYEICFCKTCFVKFWRNFKCFVKKIIYGVFETAKLVVVSVFQNSVLPHNFTFLPSNWALLLRHQLNSIPRDKFQLLQISEASFQNRVFTSPKIGQKIELFFPEFSLLCLPNQFWLRIQHEIMQQDSFWELSRLLVNFIVRGVFGTLN